jgi:arylsulfatase A
MPFTDLKFLKPGPERSRGGHARMADSCRRTLPSVNGFSLTHTLRVFLGLTLLSLVVAHGAPAARPNIIVINIDDLGYADIGPYGSNNRTPHLDRMAREGRLLTSHYGAPVCSPSRAALMTGSYPKRALPIAHVLFPGGAVGLHPDEVTIAEVLKSVGYDTACVGKWHLGDQLEFLPRQQGFDYYFGIPYSNDMGPPGDGAKSNIDKPLPDSTAAAAVRNNAKQQPVDETGIKGLEQPPTPLVENNAVVMRVGPEEQAAVTRLYTEKAVGFIRARKDRPFFLYLPHTAVHFPLYPSKNFRGQSPNGLLGDWVQEVDWSVGQVLDTVRELGLAEKTLVLFTSDNGGPLNHGASNKPLRGSKGQTLEGGIRTCTIAWWPGQIPAGTRTDAITTMMDVLPTAARLAGAALPANRKLDGVDIWPVLAGMAGEKPPRNEFLYFRGLTLDAVRSGPWKLHLALADAVPGKQKSAPQPQLFNLANDIGEAKNVAADHPDVVRRLQALAEKVRGDLGVTDVGPGCRPLGRVANAKPLIDRDGTVRAGFVGAQSRLP